MSPSTVLTVVSIFGFLVALYANDDAIKHRNDRSRLGTVVTALCAMALGSFSATAFAYQFLPLVTR